MAALAVRGRGRWLGVLAGSVCAGALLLTPDPGPVPALRLGAFDIYQWRCRAHEFLRQRSS
jgi:hypothetical protein